MALAIAAGRHPKFPTHQPITKSMYFLPRESVTMLPLVAAICSSAGSSLARGARRRAGMSDPFRAQLGRRCHAGIADVSHVRLLSGKHDRKVPRHNSTGREQSGLTGFTPAYPSVA